TPREPMRAMVDVAIRLVAGEQTEWAGALLEDLFEIRTATVSRRRAHGGPGRVRTATRWRRRFSSHRTSECIRSRLPGLGRNSAVWKGSANEVAALSGQLARCQAEMKGAGAAT